VAVVAAQRQLARACDADRRRLRRKRITAVAPFESGDAEDDVVALQRLGEHRVGARAGAIRLDE
jgi:hypothetical protein